MQCHLVPLLTSVGDVVYKSPEQLQTYAPSVTLLIAMHLLLLLQTVLSVFLPITLIAALFPSRIHCRAYELPASHLYNRQQHEQYFVPATARIVQQQAQQQQLLWGLLANCRGAISIALSRLGEELAIALRGVYLLALFAPVLMAAPLVFYAGVGRERWMQLLRWTLEQAGPAFIKWGQWGSTRYVLSGHDSFHSPQIVVGDMHWCSYDM